MNRIGIFTSNEKDWNIVQLKKVIEKRGIECVCFPITNLVAETSGKKSHAMDMI